MPFVGIYCKICWINYLYKYVFNANKTEELTVNVIEIEQLPLDYKHPTGLNMGGYWGIFENGNLVAAEKHELDAYAILLFAK